MKNTLFQIAWNLLKPFIPRKTRSGASLNDYSKRIFAQMNLAEKFGGPDLVILGDSNAENLSSKKWMDQFGEFGVSANIAISGTRPGQWQEFLRSNDNLWNQIWHAKYIVLNIGGNCILQGQFDMAKEQLLQLYSILPYSWNCLVPPVHYDILSKLTGDKDIETKFKQQPSHGKKEFIQINGEYQEVGSMNVTGPLTGPSVKSNSNPSFALEDKV